MGSSPFLPRNDRIMVSSTLEEIIFSVYNAMTTVSEFQEKKWLEDVLFYFDAKKKNPNGKYNMNRK